MTFQHQHPMLPKQTHDELARENFIANMREFLVSDLYPLNKTIWHKRIKPGFEAKHGRPPKDRIEVRDTMERENFYRYFSLLNRGTQELLWDTVGESVERQIAALIATAKASPDVGGSLELDPTLEMPTYTKAVDIHVMPGNFHTELGADDLFTGALYDRGVHVYTYAGMGPQNDGMGFITAESVRDWFPDLKPKRILEIGCGIGFGSTPLCDVFPDAEIHAIDIAAPMLRYGHARANYLGKPVHFHQMDATRTSFPDGHFDLILSNLLWHEMPKKAIRATIHEAYRLLASGGVMAHNDLLGWPEEPFEDFMADWNPHHNNEPFQRGSGTFDFRETCLAAGFAAEDLFINGQAAVFMEEQLEVHGIRGARKK